jgi:hypothetical protein
MLEINYKGLVENAMDLKVNYNKALHALQEMQKI